MFDFTKLVARLALGLPAAVLLVSQDVLAQDIVSPDAASLSATEEPARPATSAEQVDAGYLALGSELLRLNDRLAALERMLSQLVSRQEEDHRGLTVVTDELGRFRSDMEARMVEVKTLPSFALAEAAPVAAPTGPQTPTVPTVAIDRFDQAMSFARKEDWPSAELALSTFIASNPDDPRIAEARYQLGRAYLGQGQAGQAAGIHLDLFESGAAAAFGADNLFALARALLALGDVDPAQICSVYTEIDVTYGPQLSPTERGELLDLRLASDCGR